MDASLMHIRPARWTRLVVLFALLAFFVSGCGRGDESVTDDPSAVDSGIDDLDDSPGERSFEGDENIPFEEVERLVGRRIAGGDGNGMSMPKLSTLPSKPGRKTSSWPCPACCPRQR